MADIDLIPNEYRTRLQQQALLRQLGIFFAILAVAVVGVSQYLVAAVARTTAIATDLRTQNAITQQQQGQLQTLMDQRAEYQRQWSLLRGLRAGAAIDDIFLIVDRSIVAGELWFLDWGFRRAGVIVEGERRGIETGYFVVVASEEDSRGDESLEVETRMSIRGQAKDHQALSTFVRGLFEQPLVKDVNVRKTSQSAFAGGHVVSFDITVVLKSTSRES